MSNAELIILAAGAGVTFLGLIFVAGGTIRRRAARDWVSTTGQVLNQP